MYSQGLATELDNITGDNLLSFARLYLSIHQYLALGDCGFRFAAIAGKTFELEKFVELYQLLADQDVSHGLMP